MYRHIAVAVALLHAPAAVAQDGVRVEVLVSEEYGRFLAVDDRPVYMFSTDVQGTATAPPQVTCIAECQAGWPPVAGPGEAGEGVAAELLGTAEVDGDIVVTYNGWPLYHFERDTEDGPPTGQEFESFGGSWLLIDPEGAPIMGEGV